MFSIKLIQYLNNQSLKVVAIKDDCFEKVIYGDHQGILVHVWNHIQRSIFEVNGWMRKTPIVSHFVDADKDIGYYIIARRIQNGSA